MGAGAGQIPQCPDRRRRHQRRRHKTVCPEIGQPGGVGHIGLAARHIAHPRRVDQHHLQRIVEQVVERLPIVAGGLDHHTRDLLGEKVLTQCQDLRRCRAPRRHRRRRPFTALALNPHTDLRVLLRAVDTRAARVHDIHPKPPPSNEIDNKACPGESGVKQNSDTRARRQHSTVPVDKGLSSLRLICGLTGNIVRPGSTETPSSINRRPPCS